MSENMTTTDHMAAFLDEMGVGHLPTELTDGAVAREAGDPVSWFAYSSMSAEDAIDVIFSGVSPYLAARLVREAHS